MIRFKFIVVALCAMLMLFAFTIDLPATSSPISEANAVACGWFPGKLIVQRRRNARSSGRYYVGKNIGRAFSGGNRACR